MSSIALAAAFATPAFARLPVKTVTIAEKHKQYEIDVDYPKTGNKTIDAAMAEWVKGEVSQFRDDAAGNDGDGPFSTYMLGIGFDVARNDDKMFAVVFTESTYEGGAHPNTVFRTMNFLMPDGWQVYMPEIFTPDALNGIEVDPAGMLSDLHGSAVYRANLVKVMAKRAVAQIA